MENIFLTALPPSSRVSPWYITDIHEMYYSSGNGYNGSFGYYDSGDGNGVYDHYLIDSRSTKRKSQYKFVERGDGASFPMTTNRSHPEQHQNTNAY